MSKFHEEFFRRSTPDHDKLVSSIIENINEIGFLVLGKQAYPDQEVFNCSSALCLLPKHGVVSRSEIKCFSYEGYSSHPIKCVHCKDVGEVVLDETNSELFGKDRYGYIYGKSNSKSYLVKQEVSPALGATDYETEVICDRSGFIVGYADAELRYSVQFTVNLYDGKGWRWNNVESYTKPVHVIVDAKPSLDSWGGALRQIKTYMQTRANRNRCSDNMDLRKVSPYGVIATYSPIDESQSRLLEKERVYVIQFSKEGKIISSPKEASP